MIPIQLHELLGDDYLIPHADPDVTFRAGPPGTMHVVSLDLESGDASVTSSNDEAMLIVPSEPERSGPVFLSHGGDSELVTLNSKADAEAYFGAGSEACRMAGHFLPGEWPSAVRAREARAVVLAERVAIVRGIFDAARWEGRKSVKRLAKRWGCTRNEVRVALEQVIGERQPATFFPATTLGEVATTVAATIQIRRGSRSDLDLASARARIVKEGQAEST